jgi:hypothetical protein
MSVDLESVMKQLGDAAQLTGGRIIVYKDGKHIDVGGLAMADAVFSLTDAGKKLLAEEPATEPKKTTKKAGLTTTDKNDLNLEDLV